MWLAAASPPLARSIHNAVAALAARGWRTVVSGGAAQAATGTSSKPTTLTSSGARSRNWLSACRTPDAWAWSHIPPVAEWYQPLGIWEAWSHQVRGGPIPPGHFIPEEPPGQTARHLIDFLSEGTTGTASTEADAGTVGYIRSLAAQRNEAHQRSLVTSSRLRRMLRSGTLMPCASRLGTSRRTAAQCAPHPGRRPITQRETEAACLLALGRRIGTAGLAVWPAQWCRLGAR